MREHIGRVLAALQLVLETQARVVVSPARDAGHPVDAHTTLARMLRRKRCRGQHHSAGAIRDLATVLPARARLYHRVRLVIVGECKRIELPFARLRQRIAFGIAIVEFGDAVQVFAIKPVTTLVFLRQQPEGSRPHEGAINIFTALPGRSVLVLRGLVSWQILELLHTQHQHAVVTAGFDFCHGRQHPQRRGRTSAFVAHRRHAPQLRHHLRDHGSQVCLLALQFAKGVAHVNALHLRGVELALLQHAQRRFPRHVGDIQPLARPDPGKVGLVTAQNHHCFSHRVLLFSPLALSLSTGRLRQAQPERTDTWSIAG